MSRALQAVCGLLLAGNLGLGALLVWERPTHLTLPLFVPVSLEYEKAMRGGKPAGRGGEEAVRAAEIIERAALPVEAQAAVAPSLRRLADARARLLALRGERHQLNVALMQTGAAVGAELTEAQWDLVQRGRDQFRGQDDAAVFERVLSGLR